jgi:hypothetical protein
VLLVGVLLYGKTTIFRYNHLLVQSQHHPIRFTNEIKKTRRRPLLHFLRNTLLARRRDVRGLDVDRNAGLGSCVGGHVVFDIIDCKWWVVILGRMK